MIKISFLVCLLFSVLYPVIAGSPYTKPTETQKGYIKTMIDIGGKSADGWWRCKQREAAARKRGDNEMAKRWKDLAERWADLYFRTRRNAVKWVDDFYNIPKPPNTTVFYDPKCKGKYGWCGGKKTDIKVGICPADFSDGTDLIASTKIHELKHAWQIHKCMSSNEGYWDDCTYWGHYSEWEAYKESEKAHDDGIIKLEEKHKKRITDKIKEHKEGYENATDNPKTKMEGGDKKEVADTAIEIPFTIHNPLDVPVEVLIEIENELGWPMVPPSFAPVILQPEEDYPGFVMVQIPPGTPPYDTSPLLLTANGNSTDVLFITCVPTVKVTGGDDVNGAPEDTVKVDFYVENRGNAPDTFDLDVSNSFGWLNSITSPTVPQVFLNPGDIAHIQADVTIQADPTTMTTNMIFCRATSQSDPTQEDEHWVNLEVLVPDVAVLGITEPTGYSTIMDDITPKVILMNIGYVDSFFDVTWEIELPEGGLKFAPGGAIIASGTKSIPTLAPGEITEVNLDPVTFTQTGEYIITVTTQLAGDVESDNDSDSLTFSVQVTTGVKDWKELAQE